MPNLILTFISVLIGGWIGIGVDCHLRLILAGLAAAIAAAFGNVYNDIVDLPIDRKNNPTRPLPSGGISLTAAKTFAVISFALSIIIAIPLGLKALAIVVIALSALYIYSRWLKLTPWSNITVAVIASLSFLFGGVVEHNIFCLTILPLSITYHFSREMIKDIIDIEGDRMFGSRSIPIILGEDRARLVSVIMIIIFTILLPLPYLFGAVSEYYLYISSIIIIINIMISILIFSGRRQLTMVSHIYKFGMLLAIIAVILGTIL